MSEDELIAKARFAMELRGFSELSSHPEVWKFVAEFAKDYAAKWIWVAEKLPERGLAVLVHTKSGVTTVAYLCVGKPAWQVFGESGNAFDADDEIHYWMPLPLHPQGKGVDGNV